MRIGEEPVESYIERVLEGDHGVVLLSRGRHIQKAVEVSNQLCEKGYELYRSDELGFPNPEIGKWLFEPEELEVPLQRIWLKLVSEISNNQAHEHER